MTIAPRTLRPLKVSQPACYNIFAPKETSPDSAHRKGSGKAPGSLPCTGKKATGKLLERGVKK